MRAASPGTPSLPLSPIAPADGRTQTWLLRAAFSIKRRGADFPQNKNRMKRVLRFFFVSRGTARAFLLRTSGSHGALACARHCVPTTRTTFLPVPSSNGIRLVGIRILWDCDMTDSWDIVLAVWHLVAAHARLHTVLPLPSSASPLSALLAFMPYAFSVYNWLTVGWT